MLLRQRVAFLESALDLLGVDIDADHDQAEETQVVVRKKGSATAEE